MSKKISIPKPVKGYGYSGVWSDGKIGWNTTPYISGNYDRKSPSDPADVKTYGANHRYFLCEITIKPLLDKRGRPITKIIK